MSHYELGVSEIDDIISDIIATSTIVHHVDRLKTYVNWAL